MATQIQTVPIARTVKPVIEGWALEQAETVDDRMHPRQTEAFRDLLWAAAAGVWRSERNGEPETKR